ncbi:MAG TPA: insulinase family protein [Synechococcales cyanobacterium M55_K2018_004]|nr:insulinase family protein [Synechococcales cyanobacterium M55_K2018_004]
MTLTLLTPATATLLNAPTIRQLPHGLTIIAEQMPVDAVNLNVWLGVGSAVEDDSINGMAHFLEHMIFKGTQALASGEFEARVEARGASTNAATSQDYTHYYITSAPQDFAALAPHQIEVVMNATIPDEAFERERFVILEEIRRAQDNPQRRTFYRAMQASFDRLPYRRPVLGPTEVIEQLTPQQMRDFHATWYQPQFMTAVAVGNLPVEELIQIVEEGFTAAIARRSDVRSSVPSIAPVALEAPFATIRRVEHIDNTLQQARLVMTWRVPGMNQLAETYALDVLASVLSYGRTSRLVRDLREDRHLVTGISASNMTFTHQGLFYISAHLPTENLEPVEAAIAQHIDRLSKELVSEAEIQRIRTLVANRFIFGNETPSDRAGLYGYYQAVLKDITPALSYPAAIKSIEAEDLLIAAKQYLSPTAYSSIVIRPDSMA